MTIRPAVYSEEHSQAERLEHANVFNFILTHNP
jgi:hypothetical protein